MEPQDLVCAKCWTDIFNTELFEKTCTAEDDPYINHETTAFSTIDEIKNASLSGCNWCSFVATCLDISKDGSTRIKMVILPNRIRHQARPRGRNVFFVRIYHLCGEEWEYVECLDIYAFTPSDNKASAFVTARPLRTDVGSEVASDQIQSWLMGCKEHKGCSDPNTEATLPTRVIEINPSGQDEPRVIESGGLKGRYATASYCWGKTPFDTLNTSNYAQFIKKLGTRRLPLTFQDAIAVTRRLGIPYLWIDALCIIQDSENDKNREISLMKDIYASSTLTIVAACSQEVSEGFLQDLAHTEPGFTIPFRIKPNVFGTFSFGRLYDVVYDERLEPLATRAWTLQEQLLAQRTITYASHTMIWACKGGTKTFGDSFHHPYYDGIDESTSLNLNKLLMDPQDAMTLKYDALSSWCRLVSAYSLRRASFENDKLNAVAGIALHASFAPALGPEYYAGLWTYKLQEQLTWYVEFHHRSLPDGVRLESYRPKTYRAPSWSWASIEGGVIEFNDNFWPGFSTLVYCRVVECSTTPKLDQNPFGEIISAHLKVKGRLRAAWFYPRTSNLVMLPTPDAESHGIKTVSHEEAYKQYAKDFVADNPGIDLDENPDFLHGTWNTNTVGNRDENRFTEPMIVFCLAIAFEGGNPKSISGLLLRKTADQELYTRIGQFMRGRNRDFKNNELVLELTII